MSADSKSQNRESTIKDTISREKWGYFSNLDPRFALVASLMFLISCASTPAPNATPPGPSAMLVAANRALSAGQSDQAISDAASYLNSDPYGAEAAEAFYLQGRGYEQKVAAGPTEMSTNLSQARSAYVLALGRSPSAALEGNIHASLSNVSFFQDDFASAIDQASQAMKMIDAPQVKSFLLFRIGVSQQRMGEWTNADLTFNQVIQRYPGTPVAEASRQHIGQRQFYVQLATFNSIEAADRDLARLGGTGAIVTRRSDARGRTVADMGPFANYQDAKNAKAHLSGGFPDALIVP